MRNSISAASIGGCCVRALLAEVFATPKPGLVDRADSGAHRDMDLRTFFHSAAAIAPYFTIVAERAHCHTAGADTLLAALRPTGIAYEKAMLAATGGVNTHKGAIYSLGLVAAAAGCCVAAGERITGEGLCAKAAEIAATSTLIATGQAATNGLRAYRRYGITGARGEAAGGFPSAQVVLPLLRRCQGTPDNDSLLQALLALMATVDDTNVMARGGMEALRQVRRMAKDCLGQGGAFTPGGRAALVEMNTLFIRRNWSPGGSADLLAVAVALHQLEQMGETAYGA